MDSFSLGLLPKLDFNSLNKKQKKKKKKKNSKRASKYYNLSFSLAHMNSILNSYKITSTKPP
jgi:hypothetical protein